MAPQVGRDAFEMIEEYLGRRGRLPPHHNLHHRNSTPKKEPMLDTIQVAKEFDGLLLVRYAGHRIRWGNYGRLN
ncbi:hypothetical protein MUK42_36029 [Musa troglodytarum]|uniref:Uncharacterized protein n=1 Tax=Musa troglodytarum TaxID=320322 RepID=A0A9E7EBG4_9LILI|nr:hypothetical protein MUK42_36029 [Musa troglodytarum]